jgi:nuclear pore complex protein Nup88
LKQLRGELDRQRQRLEAADEVAAAVEQAGGALEGKAARVAQLQGNLAERLRLLAELHWALPRPPSHAEQRFALEQLPAYEEAAALLEADAHALRARIASLHRRLRSVGQAAAGSVAASAGESVDGASTPSIPAHQLRRVREALGEQEAQIASNQQRLAVLEAAVAVAAEARGG